MFIDIIKLEDYGIACEVHEKLGQIQGIELRSKNPNSNMFDAIHKSLKGSDLTPRNAEMLADEFADKAFTRYIWQILETR